jgi:hypothetical protein
MRARVYYRAAMNARRIQGLRRELIPAVMLLLLTISGVALSVGNDSPALHSIPTPACSC